LWVSLLPSFNVGGPEDKPIEIAIRSELGVPLERFKNPSALLNILQDVAGSCRIRGTFIVRVPGSGENISPNIMPLGWNEQWIVEYARKDDVRADPIAKGLR
jgi:hypothetical protein